MSNGFALGVYSVLSVFTLIAGLAFSKKIENKKKRIISIIISFSLFILFTASNVFIFGIQPEKKSTEAIEKVYEKVELKDKTKISKKDAVNSLTAMLKDFKKSDSKLSYEKRVEALQNDKNKVEDYVSKEALEWLYLPDILKDERAARTTSMAIISFLKMLEDYNNKNIDVKVSDYNEFVFLNANNGTAHIPVDIYLGLPANMSFEMVYVNGKWRFVPYTTIQSLNLSTTLNMQAISNVEQQSNTNKE